jgi:hypothetical protein
MPTTVDNAERIPATWWCDDHQAIHEGPIDGFLMEHREHLHPVFVSRRRG